MGMLTERFKIVRLCDLPKAMATEPPETNLACVTFDDGYRDNYERVLPVLEGKVIKATFFIASGFLGKTFRTFTGECAMLEARQVQELAALGWTFVRCCECGLVYLTPRLADLAQGYPASYSQHNPAPYPQIGGKGFWGNVKAIVRHGVVLNYGYRQVARGGILETLFLRLLGKIAIGVPPVKSRALFDFLLFPKAIPEGRLLDIGCGNGRFLAVMKLLGWDIYGVEPDPASARLAKHFTGAKIYGSFTEANFSSNFFDVITMNHVLEHIKEPLPLLNECYQILRTNGKLGIAVPNWKSMSHRIFGQYCYHLEPPRHAVMYEPRVLALACLKAGFTVETITTTSIREARTAFKKSWYYLKGVASPRILIQMWVLFSLLWSMVDKQSGEEVVLWATKR